MTLVATALCADRTVIAATQPQAVLEKNQRTLVGRLSVILRQTVAATRLYQPRCNRLPVLAPVAHQPTMPVVRWRPVEPFQFRLPPPAVILSHV